MRGDGKVIVSMNDILLVPWNRDDLHKARSAAPG
jgi:hypothetical protein